MKVSCSILVAALATIVPLAHGLEEHMCDPAVSESITRNYRSFIGNTMQFPFGPLPPAVSDVTITASFQADLNNSNEYAEVQFESLPDLPLFTLGDGATTSYPESTRPRCQRDEKTTTITATEFNTLLVARPFPVIRVSINPTNAVDRPCESDEGTVTISYTKHCKCETDVELELTQPFTYTGQDLLFDFGVLPPAISDVRIEGEFQGDINNSWEDGTVQLLTFPRTDLFVLGEGYLGSGECRTDSDSTTISASLFNSLSSSTLSTQFEVRIRLPFGVNDICPGAYGRIKVTYQRHCPCNPVVIEDVSVEMTSSGQNMVFAFGDLPQAISDVRIDGIILTEMDESADSALVQVPPSTNLFTINRGFGPSCRPRGDSTSLTAAAFNQALANQGTSNIVVHMDTSASVDPDCFVNFGLIRLSYLQYCPCEVEEEITVNFRRSGQDLFFNFGSLPPAVSDVTVTASFQADLNSSGEYAVVKFLPSSSELFRLGDSGVPYNGGSFTSHCRLDSAEATLTASDFNSVIAAHPSAQIQVSMDATHPVSAWVCSNDEGTVKLSYNICSDSSANADPHFRTWKNEHFEFHGQCDVVMTSVKNFSGQGIDLAIHLRTKMVRYWSYIKTAVIRIGDDILEVEGSPAKEDGVDKRHYWSNYEYRGELTDIGGFPVTISPRNNMYTIDLDSVYPGQKIEIKTFKEFVGVKIVGATEQSFGKAVGITGDFKSGKTFARDGTTELNDFNDLGLEWQVLPSDGKLFHQSSPPQFPELCFLPEDPRGERMRRLDESTISEEAAEAACATLKDELDRKDCVYDILATQDMDMVGAY